MSKQAVDEFITLINESSGALVRKTHEVLDGSTDPAAFVVLGRENGFEFTDDEAASFFKDVIVPTVGESDELTPEHLEMIVGGEAAWRFGSGPSTTTVTTLFRGMGGITCPTWTNF